MKTREIVVTLIKANRSDLAKVVLATAPRVGVSWESIDGKKTIDKIEGEMAFISIPGRRGHLLVHVNELAGEINFDKKQYASREKQKKEKRLLDERDALLQKEHEDTQGFADKLSARQRAKAIKTLTRQIKYEGKFLLLKKLVEKLAAEGYEVRKHAKWGRIAQHGDDYGPFLTQRQLTKTALDYLDYLRARF